MQSSIEETKEDDAVQTEVSPRAARASIAALDIGDTPNKRVDFDRQGNAIEISDVEPSLSGLPPKGFLHRAHSLDTGKVCRLSESGSMSTRTALLNEYRTEQEQIVRSSSDLPTIEQITFQKSQGSEQRSVTEEVIVPPRKVLMKMPFYSTPQSLEATNNAYREFAARLTEMGYGEQAEAALVATNAESVEAALDFIENHPEAMYHRFEADKSLNDNPDSLLSISIHSEANMLCIRCGMKRSEHIIDEKGNAIVKEDDLEMTPFEELETVIQHRVKLIAGEEQPQKSVEMKQSDSVTKLESAPNTTATTTTPPATGPTMLCPV